MQSFPFILKTHPKQQKPNRNRFITFQAVAAMGHSHGTFNTWMTSSTNYTLRKFALSFETHLLGGCEGGVFRKKELHTHLFFFCLARQVRLINFFLSFGKRGCEAAKFVVFVGLRAYTQESWFEVGARVTERGD